MCLVLALALAQELRRTACRNRAEMRVGMSARNSLRFCMNCTTCIGSENARQHSARRTAIFGNFKSIAAPFWTSSSGDHRQVSFFFTREEIFLVPTFFCQLCLGLCALIFFIQISTIMQETNKSSEKHSYKVALRT